MMDKKTTLFIILIILLAASGIYFIAIKQMVLFGATKINCVDSTSTTWKCALAGRAGVASQGGKFNVLINEPTNQEERMSMLAAKAKSNCDKFDRFTNSHKLSGRYGEDYEYKPDDHDSWIDEFPYIGWHIGVIRLNPALVVSDCLGQQLIIIEGNYEDNVEGEYVGDFKTYGLCDISDRKCVVEEPLIINIPSDIKDNIRLYPTSTTIYFREGGYSESDFEFPLSPEEEEVSEIINEKEEAEETQTTTTTPEEEETTTSGEEITNVIKETPSKIKDNYYIILLPIIFILLLIVIIVATKRLRR